MTSRNKFNKAKNSYCVDALKWGLTKLKRLAFFDSTQRKRNKKIEKEEYSHKFIKDILPPNFLYKVLYAICYEDYYHLRGYSFKVKNTYFAGSTLCVDIEKGDYKGVITITNDDYGFFNPDYFDNNETIIVDRSKLSQEDKFMLLKIKKQNNIQH